MIRSLKGNNNKIKPKYTVSQKSTLHTATSTHINQFWQFLAEMLLKEYTLSNGGLLSHLCE